MSLDILQGDAVEVLRSLQPGIAQTCVTSPPYWGLRDYGTGTWDGGDVACDHKGRLKPQRDTTRGTQAAKAVHTIPVRDLCRCGARRIDSQVGLEPTPEEYVARLIEVFREVRRVMRDDGTLWLNLGDSYAATTKGSGGQNSTTIGNGRGQSTNAGSFHAERSWSIPSGLKPKDLVGIPWRVAFALQADGWWLRSDIIWAKPNPMPESVTDRPTKAHEYLFLLAKSERYYYDAEAIAEDATGRAPGNKKPHKYAAAYEAGDERHRTAQGLEKVHEGYESRNRRTVWTVATQPFAEAHFATFPQALVEPCVLAGSKPQDLVLDPFAGSGTVGVVALRQGRRFLGIDLSPAYCKMARRRIAGSLFAEADA